MKPILFIDVDGVLLPYRSTDIASENYELIEQENFYSGLCKHVETQPALEALKPHFDFVWATTWMEDANSLRRHFGLMEDLPWVIFPSYPKRPHVFAYAGDRPFVFIDDEIQDEESESHMFVKTKGWQGLTMDYVPKILAFAKNIDTRLDVILDSIEYA